MNFTDYSYFSLTSRHPAQAPRRAQPTADTRGALAAAGVRGMLPAGALCPPGFLTTLNFQKPPLTQNHP